MYLTARVAQKYGVPFIAHWPPDTGTSADDHA